MTSPLTRNPRRLESTRAKMDLHTVLFYPTQMGAAAVHGQAIPLSGFRSAVNQLQASNDAGCVPIQRRIRS